MSQGLKWVRDGGDRYRFAQPILRSRLWTVFQLDPVIRKHIDMPSIPKKIVYRRLPTIGASIGYLLLLAAVFLLFLGRSIEALRPAFILDVAPDFYPHVSNFSISCMLCMAIGYQWLMAGTTMRPVAWLAAAIVAANFIYEYVIPFINTPDPLDAIYGLAGTLLGISVLWAIDRHGLVPNPKLQG